VLTLHASHPTWDAAEISAHIRVERRQVDATKNQVNLRAAMRQFAQIRMALRLPNVLVSDPTIYQLWAFSDSQSTALNLVGGPLSNQPVIRWIEKLRRNCESFAKP
jgi:hypothetical protein